MLASNMAYTITLNNLTDPRIAAFLEEHIADMRSVSPPESKHVFFWHVKTEDCADVNMSVNTHDCDSSSGMDCDSSSSTTPNHRTNCAMTFGIQIKTSLCHQGLALGVTKCLPNF